MKKFNLLFLVVLLFNLTSFSQTTNKKVFFKDCTAKEFKSNLDTSSNYLLIDLRPVKKFKKERIKTAKSVPDTKALFYLIDKYDKNTPIFIYSEVGDESLSAAALLMRKGYNKIYHLQEGIDGWYSDGYRLCKDKIDNNELGHL